MHVTKELSASLDYFRLMFVFFQLVPRQIASWKIIQALFPSAFSCANF